MDRVLQLGSGRWSGAEDAEHSILGVLSTYWRALRQFRYCEGRDEEPVQSCWINTVTHEQSRQERQRDEQSEARRRLGMVLFQDNIVLGCLCWWLCRIQCVPDQDEILQILNKGNLTIEEMKDRPGTAICKRGWKTSFAYEARTTAASRARRSKAGSDCGRIDGGPRARPESL